MVTAFRRDEQVGVGIGPRWGQRRPHRTSSKNLAGAYPFIASGGLGPNGVYIGPSRIGGQALVFDPFEQYQQAIQSPNVLVIGEQGRGKTSLVTTVFVLRQSLLGRQIYVLSPKPGEYRRACEVAGVRPITLEPGGPVRINPLTSHGSSRAQRLGALRAVASAVLRRPLTAYEDAGSRAVLRDDEEPIIPTVVDRLLTPPPGIERGWVEEMGLALGELCDGELAGLFDGPTSEGIALDGSIVVLDLGSLYTSAGLAVAMVCASAWLRSTIAARAGRQRLLVCDEAWKMFALPDALGTLQDSVKTSRRGVANVFCIHRLSDLAAVGDAGSRTRAVVEGLLSDCETRVIFGQADDQIAATAQMLRLSETEAAWLSKLGRGEALWKVGSQSFVVEHRRSLIEEWVTDTDAGMKGGKA